MNTITRTTAFEVEAKRGYMALSVDTDKVCQDIERRGNKVASVSHSIRVTGDVRQVWTVLVAYTKDIE